MKRNCSANSWEAVTSVSSEGGGGGSSVETGSSVWVKGENLLSQEPHVKLGGEKKKVNK